MDRNGCSSGAAGVVVDAMSEIKRFVADVATAMTERFDQQTAELLVIRKELAELRTEVATHKDQRALADLVKQELARQAEDNLRAQRRLQQALFLGVGVETVVSAVGVPSVSAAPPTASVVHGAPPTAPTAPVARVESTRFPGNMPIERREGPRRSDR